eukprot:753053-Hanusia_phi.AAC.5
MDVVDGFVPPTCVGHVKRPDGCDKGSSPPFAVFYFYLVDPSPPRRNFVASIALQVQRNELYNLRSTLKKGRQQPTHLGKIPRVRACAVGSKGGSVLVPCRLYVLDAVDSPPGGVKGVRDDSYRLEWLADPRLRGRTMG